MRLLKLLFYLGFFFLGMGTGAFLFVKISLAGTGTIVPQVVTLKQGDAERIAKKAHMAFRITDERYDLSMGKGMVVEQNPKAGMHIHKGTTLLVVISKGIEKMTVPDFTGMERSEAERRASQVGLRLRATSFIHEAGSPPVVVAQHPEASRVVPKESDLTLLVDTEPVSPVFAMPSLIGRNYDSVRRGLKLYGIAVGPARTVRVADAKIGEVVGQSPREGYPLTRNTLVQLTVNQP